MDMDVFKSNLKTLKEMILDERKLVTYISLSKELCIHVNEGKALLCQIVKDLKTNNDETKLFISYIISGLQNNNTASTTVCSETDMESLRKTYKIIFFEHIYGVSLGLTSVDNVAFAAVNKFEDLPLCVGLIKNQSCIKWTSEEIGRLKCSSIQSNVTESKTKITHNKDIKINKQVIKNGHEDVKEIHETKSEPNIKTEIASPKKDALNIGKASTKKNGKAVTKSITGFFSKANSAPVIKTATKLLTEEHKEMKSDTMDIEISRSVEPVKEAAKPKASKENKGKNKSLTQIKSNSKIDKRRKRVLHVSDSESDNDANDPFTEDTKEMEVNHESEDEIPPTPTVNTVKITSGIVNPKKKRKIVDKTYTDEEGYILTKKVEVYESCSENEEADTRENVVNTKETITSSKDNVKTINPIKFEVSPKGKGKKKVSPPQKGKQATMMNFFKKI